MNVPTTGLYEINNNNNNNNSDDDDDNDNYERYSTVIFLLISFSEQASQSE